MVEHQAFISVTSVVSEKHIYCSQTSLLVTHDDCTILTGDPDNLKLHAACVLQNATTKSTVGEYAHRWGATIWTQLPTEIH